MSTEFKTLWELHQNGAIEQLTESVQSLANNVPSLEVNSSTVNEQMIIGTIALIIIGIIFLPFGATENSIKACQLNTNQKVVKLGGAVIVVMTSISAIFFLEILELSESLGSL